MTSTYLMRCHFENRSNNHSPGSFAAKPTAFSPRGRCKLLHFSFDGNRRLSRRPVSAKARRVEDLQNLHLGAGPDKGLPPVELYWARKHLSEPGKRLSSQWSSSLEHGAPKGDFSIYLLLRDSPHTQTLAPTDSSG